MDFFISSFLLQKFCFCFRNGRPCGEHCSCLDCANQPIDHIEYDMGHKKQEPVKLPNSAKLEATAVPLRFRKNKIVLPGIAFDMLPPSTMTTALAKTDKEMNGDNGGKQVILKRVFEEMKVALISENIHGALSTRLPKAKRHRTDTFAKQIISIVKEQVGKVIQSTSAAEAEARLLARKEENRKRIEHELKLRELEEQEIILMEQRKRMEMAQKVAAPPRNRQDSSNVPDYGKIIPNGTVFTKNFDVLGEFKGVVVAVPNSSNPYYQVEYEDGGREALLHPSLVALLRTST